MDLATADQILQLLEQETKKVQGIGELRAQLKKEVRAVSDLQEGMAAASTTLNDAIGQAAQIGQRADEIGSSLETGLNALHEELKSQMRDFDSVVTGRLAEIGQRADEIGSSLETGLNALHEELKSQMRDFDSVVAGRLVQLENQLQAELRREIAAGLDRIQNAARSDSETLRELHEASFRQISDRFQGLSRFLLCVLFVSLLGLAASGWLAWQAAVTAGIISAG